MQFSLLCLLGDRKLRHTEHCPNLPSPSQEDIQDDSKMYSLVRLETQIYL